VNGGIAAPIIASASAAAACAAIAARRPAVLAALAPAGSAPPSPIERVGRSTLVRTVTAADRLGTPRTPIRVAGSRISVDRLVGGAVAIATLVVALGIVAQGPGPLLGLIVAVVVVRAPVFAAGRAERRRLRAIDRDVPLLLDVVSLAAFAGLPPPAALGRAVAVIDGPLADEVGAALVDVDLGARWRDRLRRLPEDVPVADLRRVIDVLVRSESIGSSTAEPVSILADEVRAARRAAVAERARKAPVQMLFPLVFLVLPAFLLLTVVPVLVATLGSIR
jgi:tight adherence protein C